MQQNSSPEGPFAAWVENYQGDNVVLRVVHDPENVPQELIPVSECGKLALGAPLDIVEECDPDGTVRPHIVRAS